MNRDIMNVIFGGMNVAAPAKKGEEEKKEHVETTVTAVAAQLVDANKICIVPGYGMAQARAQNPVGELCSALQNAGKVCEFIIHPVAGRMPGQMNVLLAEAGVPYDYVKEMDEVNENMDSYDICIVLGANDITNSAAEEVEGCAIWGMPVIKVWQTKKTIFCKRSMAGGYADLENPVFFKENTNHGRGRPTRTSKMLDPILEETAISPLPCLATTTEDRRYGMEVPAARTVTPATSTGMPRENAETLTQSTIQIEDTVIQPIAPMKPHAARGRVLFSSG